MAAALSAGEEADIVPLDDPPLLSPPQPVTGAVDTASGARALRVCVCARVFERQVASASRAAGVWSSMLNASNTALPAT